MNARWDHPVALVYASARSQHQVWPVHVEVEVEVDLCAHMLGDAEFELEFLPALTDPAVVLHFILLEKLGRHGVL